VARICESELTAVQVMAVVNKGRIFTGFASNSRKILFNVIDKQLDK
jgi:hypothetical protein